MTKKNFYKKLDTLPIKYYLGKDNFYELERIIDFFWDDPKREGFND